MGDVFDDWDSPKKVKSTETQIREAQKQHDEEKAARKRKRKVKHTKRKALKPRQVGVLPAAERALNSLVEPVPSEPMVPKDAPPGLEAETRRLTRMERRKSMLPKKGASMTCPICDQPRLKMSLWVEDEGRLICRKCFCKKYRPVGDVVTVGRVFDNREVPEATWEFNWAYLERKRIQAGIGIQHLASAMGISHVTYINRRDKHIMEGSLDRVSESVAKAILSEFYLMNYMTGDVRELAPWDAKEAGK
jgi:hypothetical protein